MLAGRPHEAAGNGSPRWMAVGPLRRVHRTRPTGRLTRRPRCRPWDLLRAVGVPGPYLLSGHSLGCISAGLGGMRMPEGMARRAGSARQPFLHVDAPVAVLGATLDLGVA